MARQYRYLFCDLMTDTLLAELPVMNASFDIPLNGYGGFSGSVPLNGSAKITALDPLNATQEARTALWIEVDGVLVWGGVIWTSGYDSASQSLQLAGNDFWSYFHHRKIRTTLTYTATDQLVIARDLLSYAQTLLGPVADYRIGFPTGGNIGVTLGSETSGVNRDRTYNAYEEKDLAAAIEELSQVQNGFDFSMEVRYVGTPPVRTKIFKPSYPRRGVTFNNSGFVWEYPGNILDYRFRKDGTMMSDSHLVQGAGSAENTLTASAFRGDLIDNGYPLLQSTGSHGDVTVPATLQSWANSELTSLAAPVFLPEVDVRADLFPQFGTYQVGDEARFRFGGTYAYKGILDQNYRIYAVKVQPQEKGQAEKITLTLGPVL